MEIIKDPTHQCLKSWFIIQSFALLVQHSLLSNLLLLLCACFAGENVGINNCSIAGSVVKIMWAQNQKKKKSLLVEITAVTCLPAK